MTHFFSGEGNGTIPFYTAEKFITVGDKRNRPERLKHTDSQSASINSPDNCTTVPVTSYSNGFKVNNIDAFLLGYFNYMRENYICGPTYGN